MKKNKFVDRDVERLRKLAALNPDAYDTSPVRLLEDHGFINEYGAVYSRRAGEIVTVDIEIIMLRDRGASVETV